VSRSRVYVGRHAGPWWLGASTALPRVALRLPLSLGCGGWLLLALVVGLVLEHPVASGLVVASLGGIAVARRALR
jgi:hypothetical protein